MKFRMRTLAPVTALAIGAALAAVTPANAAGPSSCPSGKLCLYGDANFSGPVKVFSSGSAASLKSYHYDGTNTAVDNTASSVINNTEKAIFLYSNSNFTGPYVPVGYHGGSISDLSHAIVGGSEKNLNDAISSFN